MDFATLLGLLLGLALVLAAIIMGGDIGLFVDVPSMMIVFGGTFGTIFVAFPFEEVKQAFYAGFKAFSSRKVRVREVVGTMDRVRIVRHPQRICLKDILENVYDNYTEIGGQDEYSIDPSMRKASGSP